MKFKTEYYEVEIHRTGNETVAWITPTWSRVPFRGAARRNPKDNDNKDIGRRLALHRAMWQVPKELANISRDGRKEIFAEYDRIIKQGRAAGDPAVSKTVTAAIHRTSGQGHE